MQPRFDSVLKMWIKKKEGVKNVMKSFGIKESDARQLNEVGIRKTITR